MEINTYGNKKNPKVIILSDNKWVNKLTPQCFKALTSKYCCIIITVNMNNNKEYLLLKNYIKNSNIYNVHLLYSIAKLWSMTKQIISDGLINPVKYIIEINDISTYSIMKEEHIY